MKLCMFVVVAILLIGSAQAYTVVFQNDKINQTQYLNIINQIDSVKDIDQAGVKKIIIRDYLYWTFRGQDICGFAWYHTGIFTINDKAYRDGLCGKVTSLSFDIAHEVCHHDMIKNIRTCNEGNIFCNEEYADRCAAEIWLLMDEGDINERTSQENLQGIMQTGGGGSTRVVRFQGPQMVSEAQLVFRGREEIQGMVCVSS